MKNNFACIIAGGLLALMFALAFFSSWNETATFDEVAHIPAGYSYLTQKDMRLNPEHPPLMKDISALPLLFLNLNFPTDTPVWSEKISDRQWDMGKLFLYRAGNDADKIIRLARLPMMLLAVLFGVILFYWTKKNYGNRTGLLTLFLFAMSPTIIAHSRYVTTDVAAALGFFIAIISFLNFLKNQNWRNVLIGGAVLGVALLFKFSTVILAPIFFVLAVLWQILDNYENSRKLWSGFAGLFGKIIVLGLAALVLVYVVYIFHVWNYPSDLQIKDMSNTLSSDLGKKMMPAFTWMVQTEFFKPLAEYLFGVVSVVQRAGGGNASHFMGTVYSEATPWYFPTLYLFKESFIFHILTIIAIIFALKNISRATVSWIKNNFAVVAGLIFIAVYALQSITGNLNIGHRHIMPILPFAYFLVALGIVKFNKPIITTILLAIMFLSTFVTFPYYLSYYNFLAGGTANGYKIATDSNYDWGQDMKRLRDWMDTNNVQKIALHYFGGGDARYYFGDPEKDGVSRYEDWWSSKGQPPVGSWFAISANAREGSMAKPVRGFTIKPDDTYSWLKGKEPAARAGSSIFIYKF